jgi:2-polyprenyl-6-methoxyphenol hydroxylase-like FAD-dependent oxidoreductase
VADAATLVVGADGKHSLVADFVSAPKYNEQAAHSCGYYSYWAGVPLAGGEMYARERRMIGAWPTNGGLTMTYVAWPVGEFHAIRADAERSLLSALELAGDLGQRVRAGTRVETLRGTADLPSFFRTPFGPGWALVGDAGLVMDPITGQGIADAFRDAELLTEAIDAGLSDRESMNKAMAAYEEKRNRAAQGMYDFTTKLAAFPPPKVEEMVLFESLAGRADQIERFLGFLTGTVPAEDYFSPANLRRVLGLRGFVRILARKLRSGRRRPSTPEAARAAT